MIQLPRIIKFYYAIDFSVLTSNVFPEALILTSPPFINFPNNKSSAKPCLISWSIKRDKGRAPSAV